MGLRGRDVHAQDAMGDALDSPGRMRLQFGFLGVGLVIAGWMAVTR
ncbi:MULTISPECIES: hypothetical protein [unclassified Streptomyces]|nr:hypothetical protein [Streptomyces sp. me109]